MAIGGWVAIHQDITSQKRAEAELAHMARYDALTGLANRALFMEKANEALARMRAVGEGFSVLMLDLDRFKSRQRFARSCGRRTLLQDRCRAAATGRDADVDTVARLGGDEFAIHSDGAARTTVMARSRWPTASSRSITEPYDLDGRKSRHRHQHRHHLGAEGRAPTPTR